MCPARNNITHLRNNRKGETRTDMTENLIQMPDPFRNLLKSVET